LDVRAASVIQLLSSGLGQYRDGDLACAAKFQLRLEKLDMAQG